MKFRSFGIVLSLLLLCYTTISFWGTSVASTKTDGTSNLAVEDQVAQYNVAVRAGTKMDRCVQAGFVASAYIQSKDQANYEEWLRIRHEDCSAAGLSQ